MERNRYLTPILALALVAICVHPSYLAAQADRDPLRSAMAKRIDEGKQGTGAVVGLLTPQGRSFAAYGRISLGGPEVAPDTIFEIGSITKVFTAFLLADMVERGEVRLDDPVRKFLPASVKVPSRGGKEILRRRIFEPLGMTSTTITVDASQHSRRATGYNGKQLALQPFTVGVLDPTGGVNSTAADMLKFGAAMVDPNSPLKAAFARMTSVRRPSDGPRSDQVLGWGIFRLGPNELVGHSGGTLGFQARLIVDLTRKRSVVAWINGQGESVTELVGMALDRPSLQ